jgi:hypothetical protein
LRLILDSGGAPLLPESVVRLRQFRNAPDAEVISGILISPGRELGPEYTETCKIKRIKRSEAEMISVSVCPPRRFAPKRDVRSFVIGSLLGVHCGATGSARLFAVARYAVRMRSQAAPSIPFP